MTFYIGDSDNRDRARPHTALQQQQQAKFGRSYPRISPERDSIEFGDSDIESVISATSAFSTQSERIPRRNRG